MVLNLKHTSPRPHFQGQNAWALLPLGPTLSPAGSMTLFLLLLLLSHTLRGRFSPSDSATESLIHRPTPLITSFSPSQNLQTLPFCGQATGVPLTSWPHPQAASPSPILLGALTCRPSSSAMPSRVVSGGVLAGVAVLQASCASLKSKAGEWIFCWMEPNTVCSHLGSPGGGEGTLAPLLYQAVHAGSLHTGAQV